MTEESKRENVADELRLAESALSAAETLLSLGLLPDAASRAYYAAFHAARALLYSEGLEVRTHSSLRSLLSQHFVRSGRLSARASKELGQLESLRTSGDYDSAFALGEADVAPEVAKARQFVAEAKAILGK